MENEFGRDIKSSLSVTFPNLPDEVFQNIQPREVILSESLLTPGLQTSIKLHAHSHELIRSLNQKNFDFFKGEKVEIEIGRPILEKFGYNPKMEISQTVYRLGGRSSTSSSDSDSRKLLGRAVEELTFHACDMSLLTDASSLVSKSWKCTKPSEVVEQVLRECAGAKNLEIENTSNARDYVAENIHPFQVIAQQSNASLTIDNDPSFVHFMTYENMGTHHFKSLQKMSEGSSILKADLEYSSAGSSYTDPHSIMSYNFPCDFDLLSDILNGLDSQGKLNSSVALFNPMAKIFSQLGNQTMGCGVGAGVHKVIKSNQNTEKNENSCPDYAASFATLRQARMGLLDKDKVAIRMVVPWNPIYHAGKVVRVTIRNLIDSKEKNYGSGDYLISALTHNIKQGGYSTTTLDCVSTTVGKGIV